MSRDPRSAPQSILSGIGVRQFLNAIETDAALPDPDQRCWDELTAIAAMGNFLDAGGTDMVSSFSAKGKADHAACI